jgi:predicted Zn-dependent protease with MMP-like domain
MKFDRLAAIAAETVAATQRRLPPEIRALAAAVPVHYEAEPDASLQAEGFPADLLGLFTGTPYGEELAEAQPLPPQILLYINSLWEYSERDQAILRDEVRLTYLHELGHYLGWDEDQIAARGLE